MKKLILSLITLAGCATDSGDWCKIASKADYLIKMKSDSTAIVMDRAGTEREMHINNIPKYLKR